jgi:hypothetical protein
MRRIVPGALACLLFLDAPPAADACGASAVSAVGALLSAPRESVSALLSDAWEGYDLVDFRFLRPFELGGLDPRGYLSRAYAFTGEASGETPDVPAVDATALREALEAGDLATAVPRAAALVEAILDLPAPVAADYGEELQQAVELLELAPGLGAVEPALLAQFFGARAAGPLPLPEILRAAQRIRDTPRASLPALLRADPRQARTASLELVALGARVHGELPDGWQGQIAAPAPVWDGLLHGYDAWLAAHPQHPLADLARLDKLRVLYLRGDAEHAWELLLAIYPRHRLRVAWEMRHLLLADMRPAALDLTRLKDPLLATALVRESTALSPSAWAALFKRARAAAPAPWAENLEERLLVQALRIAGSGGALVGLPKAPERRSQRWMALYTAVLLASGRDDDALAQAHLLARDDDARVGARLLAQAELRHCHFAEAAAAAERMDPEAARYLLEVLADDASLVALGEAKGPLAARATRALALRKLRAHDFAAAAALWEGKADKLAPLFREAARRAADVTPEGRIALARWLLGPSGAKLLPDKGRAYSRGLKQRLDAYDRPRPDDPSPREGVGSRCGLDQERARLADLLVYGGRREQALQLYATALRDLAPTAKRARPVLRDADALYNKLLSWDASYAEAFPALLAGTEAARTLREVGKSLR